MNWVSNLFKSPVEKLTEAERLRLERLRAQTHGRYLRALNAFLAQTQSDATLRRVIALLEGNDLEGVMRLIDSHVAVLSNTLPQRFNEIATAETADLINRVSQSFPDEMSVGVGFDPTHERAARIIAANRLEFVRNYTRKQRDVTRTALVDALRTGKGPIDAARVFRDTMGLTSNMWSQIGNYRKLLQTLSPEALVRDLRDRRFDGTIESAIDNARPLSQIQIDKMVERYRKRMEMYRSEMIARTETTKSLALARDEAQKQVHAQAGIPDSWIKRRWNTSMDGRERATHHAMNGQVVDGMNSYFVSPSGARLKYPGDPEAPAEEIINCRCNASIEYTPQIVPRSQRQRR